ncbi:hypothetical protein EUGRSUZ_B03317 [Eucalyptus grandis]|uniref:Uncharacterized protein n=2 Tax=Eucalyptus grandis TaxID=71139 RepID=A0ACC3LVR5_EUCGR|nr:hypothetical protein EUGRSUZ_B03317 [Eucalyptus grandis]
MSLTGATPPTSSTSPPTSPPSPPPPSSPDSSASSPPPNSSASPPSPPPPSSSSPPPTPPAESKAKAPPKFSPPPAPASSSGSSPPSPPPTPPASPPPSPPQSSAPSGSPPPPDQLSPPPPPAPVSGTGAVPAPAISPPPPTSSTGPSPPIASTSPPPPSAPTASGSPPAAPTNSTPTTNSGSTPPSQTSSRIPTSTSNSTSGGSSTPSSSTSTVIGAAAAGVFLVALIALVVLVLRRKKRKEGAFASKYVPPSGLSPQSDKYYYGQQPHMMGGTGHSGPYYGSQGQNSSIENSFGSQRGGGNMYHGGGGDSSVIPSSKSFFTYEELMEITNGFSHQNIIGEGGFGCVYKGWLSDGKLVAVKQLKAGSGQGDREFKAEVEIISRVHHRHLVSLVGYSMAENQRLLIYEFVPNKTLEHHLHEKGLPVLEWTKRVKIALGSAKGLAYLHEDCHPKIIHRDIKSANILLDDAFEAQVADFGLAKLTNDANTHVSTRVMGTFGYLAPEYASSGKLTDRSDVFSFGVVLLELITGRKPVDATQPLGDESLVEWARPLLLQALETGDPSELVDPRLEKNYVEGEMFRMIEAAAACIRHSAAKRPRMVQVVRALDSEGDMSDLTNGVKYGQSTVYDSGQYNEDIMKFRRMALGSGDSSDYGPYSGDYSSREVSGAQKIPWKSRDSSNEFTSSESETRAMNPLNSEKRFPGVQGGYGMRRFS